MMCHELFGDSGPGNDDRADWARTALEVFCGETGLDLEVEFREAVGDLLADLGHFCDRQGLDFLELAAGSIAVWDVEKREEENGESNALYPEKRVYIQLITPN